MLFPTQHLRIRARATLLMVAGLAAFGAATHAHSTANTPPSLESVRSSLGSSTLPWVPNNGQWAAHAAFRAQSFAGSVWMTHDGKLVHQFNGPKIDTNDGSAAPLGKPRAIAAQRKPGWVLTERFVGGVVKQIEGVDPQAAKANYFIADKPTAADLQSFGELSLGEVYTGVTVALKATHANVEKLYTVAPERDPAVIRMQIDGANGLSIAADGSLQAATDNGPLAFTPPVAFQHDAAGYRTEVKVAYALDADARQYGFTVGDYDRSRPLTIDPLLGSTYFGGSNTDQANAIAIHPSSGVVYITGAALSADLPGTGGGALPTKPVGPYDAYIARFNSSLTTLLGATYFGGSGFDLANAIAINPNTGNVYITGSTGSSSLPGTAGSPQPSAAGGAGDDTFVAVFNSSLDTLIRSSFHGAAGDDQAFAIAYHPSTAEIYIGGFTTGVNLLPGRIGGAQATSGVGRPDCFVTRFSADLTQRLQSTYISGTSGTLCELKGLAVHPLSGDIYAVGLTNHPGLTGAAAGVQPTFTTNRSAFVTRLNKELTIISASSYNNGGSNFSGAEAVAIHPTLGDIYVGGYGDTPNTAGGALSAGSGSVSRFNAALSTRYTATYVSTNSATVTSLIFNAVNGNVYAAGDIGPGVWPQAAQGVQTTFAGGANETDGFVVRLSFGLSTILGATFYGSTATDEIRGIAYNPLSGNVYVAGQTFGANLPGTSVGAQPASGGDRDAFVAVFTPDLGSAGVTPNPFTLNPRLNVAVNSTLVEGPIQITGLTAFANVSIIGALGSVCISTTSGCSCNASGNVYVTGGLVANNQYLCVKNVAAASASTLSDSTITVGGYTTKFMNYTGQLFACTMDIDGDGVYHATTDGLILSRAMMGMTGTAVTNGVVGHNPPRNTWALIRQHLNSSCGMNLAQ